MRITNRMMTNGMLSNINGNKERITTLENQYATGLKIQKPSDDPIVAVRALKLRTNLAELNQYYEKNIPDAMEWMDVTEGAMKNINSILTTMNTCCVQGAQDTLTVSDRNAIAENLTQMRDQIYQEGNANYAGRYVFTGYKTESSLVFGENTEDYDYVLTEKLDFTHFDTVDKILNSADLSLYDPDSPETSDFSQRPNSVEVYRVRLAYNNLVDGDNISISLNPQYDEFGNVVKDADGNIVYEDVFSDVNVVSSQDPDAFTPADGTVNFIPETGELILSKDVYDEWTREEKEFHVTYEKNSFMKNELKPEHYFDCVRTTYNSEGELDEETAVNFTKEDQKITYEINFNQKLQINTQGSDAISHNIGRMADEILTAIDEVVQVENRIAQVDRMLADSSITDEQKTALTTLKDMLSTEKVLREEVLKDAFSAGITETQKQQEVVGIAVSDLGSRYVRLELTESRLATQQDDFTDLLSKNEDADLVDTIINFTAAQTVYDSSLSAAAKVVQNSLLDFL